MAIQTTRDILDFARGFHKQLSAFYAHLSDVADKERMKMLLNYMSRHEKHMEEWLLDYEHEAAKEVLDNWFKHTPPKALCDYFEGIELKPEMSLDEVINISLKLDNCLIELYKEVAERATSPKVKELFLDLLEMEKKEEIKCIRDALLFEQI